MDTSHQGAKSLLDHLRAARISPQIEIQPSLKPQLTALCGSDIMKLSQAGE